MPTMKIPYLAAPGSIEKALQGIKQASVPQRVTGDFAKSILKLPGGTGTAIVPYLKRMGFVNSDGSPTDLYKSFRNESQSGSVIYKAMKIGYAELYKHNEYVHAATDREIEGLIIQITGAKKGSPSNKNILRTFKNLKKFGSFDQEFVPNQDTEVTDEPEEIRTDPAAMTKPSRKIGINYTINLQLPETDNIKIFNAIFKSLKEQILDN